MGGFGLADRTDPSDLRHFFLFSFSQFFHNILKDLRMKQLPKNLFFGIRLRPQKLHKLSLCDHCHLHKLAFSQSQNFYQSGIRFLLRIFPPVWHK